METLTLSAPKPAAGCPVRPIVRRPIAVIVSRFPLITETFILREIEELERQGQPVVLVPLIRERGGVAHREAERWVRRMVHAPFVSLGVLAANVRAAWRNPSGYGGALAELVAGSAHSPNVLLRTLALFPKTVYLSTRLADLGVRHVHAHFATYPAGAALTMARLDGATFSFTAHAHDIFVPWRRASLPKKIERAEFVRVVAQSGREQLLACTDAQTGSKIHVIHVGVRLEDYQFDPPSAPDDTGPNLLCVAALKPYKGLAVLLEACHRLKQAGRRFRCEIVGDGPLRSAIERLRASMDLGDRVTLRGALRQDEVTALLAHAHIALAPSIVAPDGQMDGIPVALMEAMAAGRPVVASRLSGVPELVDDGVTGFLTEPGNATELAAAIQRLLDDRMLAARMGERGREKIAREFRLDYCVDALLSRLDAHNPAPLPPSTEWSEAIQRLLPGLAVGVRRVRERPDSAVLELVVADGGSTRELVLKIHAARAGDRRSASERAAHEQLVLERLHAMSAHGDAGAAVPLVLGRAGVALLLEFCAGTPLVEQARRARVGRRACRAELVESVRRTGRWLRVFQQLTDRHSDSDQMLHALVEGAYRHLDACVATRLLAAGDRLQIENRLAHLSELVASSPALASSPAPNSCTVGHHGDFWPGNVFVDGQRVVAVDFEGFRQGLPYEDVAYFLVQLELYFPYAPFRPFRRTLCAAFLDGYCDGVPVDEVAYAFCRLVKALQLLAPDGRTGTSTSGRERRRLRALRAMVVGG